LTGWKIYVLRLNHRSKRDKRLTTHLLLAGRAFGAAEAFYSGEQDGKVEESMEKVIRSWGGSFRVEYVRNWRSLMRSWKAKGGEVIHLTMYGLPLQDVIERVKASPKDKLVIVGGAKVPGATYELSDWNISVTSQPHSEVSALSVFLHELFGGRELSKVFSGAETRIVPQPKGKKVVKSKS
jgi:tRNA (cytidine56-2'-O)-methyltransferase